MRTAKTQRFFSKAKTVILIPITNINSKLYYINITKKHIQQPYPECVNMVAKYIFVKENIQKCFIYLFIYYYYTLALSFSSTVLHIVTVSV